MRTSAKIKKARPLVIIGDSVFAQLAYEYYSWDSPYEVVAFSVERRYLRRATLLELPVVEFEELENLYSARDHSIYAAIVFTEENRLRTRLYQQAMAKGYAPASYICSRARVSRTAKIGEHCFICEQTIIHSRARIGNNVVLWSGNFIGYGASVGDNCFTLPHAQICAFAEIGRNCIIGPNAALLDHVLVAENTRVEAAALIGDATPSANAK